MRMKEYVDYLKLNSILNLLMKKRTFFKYQIKYIKMSQLSKRSPPNAAKLGMAETKSRPKTALRLNFDDYDVLSIRSKRKIRMIFHKKGKCLV